MENKNFLNEVELKLMKEGKMIKKYCVIGKGKSRSRLSNIESTIFFERSVLKVLNSLDSILLIKI